MIDFHRCLLDWWARNQCWRTRYALVFIERISQGLVLQFVRACYPRSQANLFLVFGIFRKAWGRDLSSVFPVYAGVILHGINRVNNRISVPRVCGGDPR